MGGVYRLLNGREPVIDTALQRRLRVPPPVPTTSIYSRSDGVVSWRSCLDVEAETTENVEVQGSHIGLLHNPAVLYVIADRLAQEEGSHRSFEPPGWLRRVVHTGPYREAVTP